MHTVFGANLAFFLFLPVFLILGVLYCAFPRRPRGALRLLGDLAVLVVAAAASIFAMRYGFALAAEAAGTGAIWKQVLATLVAYATFLACLGIAIVVRASLLRNAASKR